MERQQGVITLFLWSEISKESIRIKDSLYNAKLCRTGEKGILNAIRIDNSINRNYVLNNARGIRITNIPCYVIVKEVDDKVETHIIDDYNQVIEATNELLSRTSNYGEGVTTL